jgi:hypothetical protein
LLKKLITYTNPFTGREVTEAHYFHISKADLIEMEMEENNTKYTTKDGTELSGMQAYLQRIIDSEDGKQIIQVVKDILRRAYGKKVDERFVKSDALWQEFVSSEAYSQLFYELCTDAEANAAFMASVVPSGLEQETAKLEAQALTNGTKELTPDNSSTTDRQKQIAQASSDNPVTLTEAELREIDSVDLKSGIAAGKYKLS